MRGMAGRDLADVHTRILAMEKPITMLKKAQAGT